MTQETGEQLLSRTGVVSPIGTLTEELKTKVDASTEQAFRRICSEAGTDVSGALRNYVCKIVHGKSFDELVLEVSQRRRLMLAAEGPIGAPIGTLA
jgi:antitoxin component of RelBE/YafQ-DinJ toxin-antitoxin module